MGLILLNGPAIEPLDRDDDAKLHLRLEATFDDDDELVDSLIIAARQYVEENTGRALITQTWELTLDQFPWPYGPGTPSGYGSTCWDTIDLPRPNLLSVTSVKYVDTAGVLQTMSTSEYSVDLSSLPGRVVLGYGKCWPVARCQRKAVYVTYTAGYGPDADDVPWTLKQAMLLLIGHWYENRESVNIGNIVNTIPMAVDALLAPYRVLEVA